MKNSESGTRRTIKRLMPLVAMLVFAFGILVVQPQPSAAITPQECNELTEGCQTGGGTIVANVCESAPIGTFILATCTKANAVPADFEEFSEECEDLGTSASYTFVQLGPNTFSGVCLRL
jgi:hypothetical protein